MLLSRQGTPLFDPEAIWKMPAPPQTGIWPPNMRVVVAIDAQLGSVVGAQASRERNMRVDELTMSAVLESSHQSDPHDEDAGCTD